LLIFCQPQDAAKLLTDLNAENIDAVEIGFTSEQTGRLLTLT